MHDLSASHIPPPPKHTHTHTHTHTQRNPSWRQTFPFESVCDMAAPLLKTNRGNPPCLALSIIGHLNIPRHVPGWKSSLTLLQKLRDSTNTPARTHTHPQATWLQTSSPDAGTHSGRKFKERFVAFYFCQNTSDLTPS
ncbi:hypothetical protein CRENBAI_008811 [Crenichthys baileyi]|uniref:Uncharacterized protein n=1 Tax=Crenichthys baileyi TaxID=28760 RepID=A0AAV9R9L6_9TELE